MLIAHSLLVAILLQSAPASRPQPPRLAVVVVFDQMRGDYLEKYRAGFGEGGFLRLVREGTWYARCNYPYANTETGPGHTTIATGRFPSHHGIVANDWYDRAARRGVYCYADSAEKGIGPAGPVVGGAVSPKNLLGETLADRLRAERPASRVFSISQKDRAAIPMGGRRPNGTYWFFPGASSFITSTFFKTPLPAWIGEFAAARSLDKLPKVWERALALEAYAPFGPDDEPWEKGRGGEGRVFPHPLDARKEPLSRWDAINTSPVSLTILTDLALDLLEREKLGRGASPDLLCISYSATDWVGHYFGPDSHEALDIYARADRELERLLKALDAQVGAGRYAVALCSDHGASEVPERARTHGVDAGRLRFTFDGKGGVADDLAKIEDLVSGKLGRKPASGRRWTAFYSDAGFYLDAEELKAQDVDPAKAAAAYRDALVESGCVESAFTAADVREGKSAKSLALSYFAERSGDVLAILKPHWLATTTPSSHGTPHPYDTHVPLLLVGPGAAAGIVSDAAVTPADLAPSVAAMLGLAASDGWDGRSLVAPR